MGGYWDSRILGIRYWISGYLDSQREVSFGYRTEEQGTRNKEGEQPLSTVNRKL
jgi:hypothetical protein